MGYIVAFPHDISQTVEKPLTGFSDKFLQSAARTPCSPMANNSHTCSLRCIFCQVHAPTENDLILFVGLRRQTLRGFFDKLGYIVAFPHDISRFLLISVIALVLQNNNKEK